MGVSRSRSRPWDEIIVDQLQDPVVAAEYLVESIDAAHPELFLRALRNVADAQGGPGAVSRATGLNRQSLYRMLSNDGNPRLSSLVKVLDVLGLKLTIRPRTPAA